MVVALQEWLKRIPAFSLDSSKPTTWSQGTVRGPRNLADQDWMSRVALDPVSHACNQNSREGPAMGVSFQRSHDITDRDPAVRRSTTTSAIRIPGRNGSPPPITSTAKTGPCCAAKPSVSSGISSAARCVLPGRSLESDPPERLDRRSRYRFHRQDRRPVHLRGDDRRHELYADIFATPSRPSAPSAEQIQRDRRGSDDRAARTSSGSVEKRFAKAGQA